MKPLTRTLSVMALAIVAAGAGLAVNRMNPQAAANASANGPASAAALYDMTFPDASGKNFPLAGLKGHVVVVNFWATWCVPCVKEIPALSKMSADYAKKVQFVGIGIDSGQNIAEFAAKSKAAYPLLVATAGATDLVRAFGDKAGGLPFTIVIDDKGLIRQTKMGPVDEDELRAWLLPLTKS